MHVVVNFTQHICKPKQVKLKVCITCSLLKGKYTLRDKQEDDLIYTTFLAKKYVINIQWDDLLNYYKS